MLTEYGKKILAAAAVALALLFLAGCGGRTDRRPYIGGTGDSSDEIYSEDVYDAKIRIFLLDGRAFTIDYLYEINAYSAEDLKDGGFYEITADVTFLNGGIAGYVDYPEIRRITECREISPFDLGLPEITENIYGLTRIGDYADGDLFLYGYGKMLVWKDGEWIYRYDRTLRGEDGTIICCRSDISDAEVLTGVEDGILSCEDFFVLPKD